MDYGLQMQHGDILRSMTEEDQTVPGEKILMRPGP